MSYLGDDTSLDFIRDKVAMECREEIEPVSCPRCRGSGGGPESHLICRCCDGTGEVSQFRTES